jgi:hypothetical protein
VAASKGKRDLGVSIKLGGDKGKHQPAEASPAPCAGEKVEFTAASDIAEGSYVTFVSGLMVVSVKGEVNGKILMNFFPELIVADLISPGKSISADVPAVVEGQSYVFVTSKDANGTFDATAVLAGPAILEVAPQPPTIDFSES